MRFYFHFLRRLVLLLLQLLLLLLFLLEDLELLLLLLDEVLVVQVIILSRISLGPLASRPSEVVLFADWLPFFFFIDNKVLRIELVEDGDLALLA